MNRYKLRNSLILLLTATIWGISFVSQSVGVKYVGPFTFNGLRLLMGGLVLLPLIAVRSRMNPAPAGESSHRPPGRYIDLRAGVLCGLCLFAASSLQQIGIQYTTAGKSGFITAFYIILVPVISLFLGQKCSPLIWAAVVIAMAGLYLISIREGFSIGRGDLLTFACAFIFAVHILLIDRFAPLADGIRMSCIQFFTAGLISMIFVAVFERTTFSGRALVDAWMPLCYSGIMSAGVGYTLQIVGQKGLNPSVASLLMSMESCISAIAGWLILGQALSGRELAGCALMMLAIILADLLPFFSERGRIRRSRKSASG